MRLPRLKQAGFTLVEVVLVVPAALLVAVGLVVLLINLYVDTLRDTAVTQMAYEAQQALFNIKDDAYTAYSFAEAPNPLTSEAAGHAPPGGWKYNVAPFPLIIEEIALNRPRQLENSKVVYMEDPNGCDGEIVQKNPPLINNLIIYVDSNGDLRRRILVPDPVHEYCKNPYRQQSCPTATTRIKELEGGGTQTVACPADSVLAKGVISFTVKYYDSENIEVTPITIGAGASPIDAEKIDMSITLRRTVNGDPVEYTAKLTVTRNNNGDGVPDDPAEEL